MRLEDVLRSLTDQQLLECCESLADVEAKKEGMYLGATVDRIREEVGDEQFYAFEKLVNAECRHRWYQEHK
ncbi:MAG: hypothetical protein E7195_03805 [Peptococcaceae bacterium]|nr:hypothetical protein [Peptococcaceae bacterium]MBQ3510314.1 hypothetical protein [Peptococcaceae bacterium]